MEDKKIEASEAIARQLKRERAILRTAFANRKRSERLYNDSDLAKQDLEH